MKDYWKETIKPVRKLNKKKISVIIYAFLIIISLIILISLYVSSQGFRNWIDKNILRKEITQNNVTIIDLDAKDNYDIYAYDKYITILNRNILSIYNESGKEEKKLDIDINNAIFEANNKFLAIAEEKGKKIYLLSGTSVLWTSQVEGDISQIYINKNGYMAVVITNTSYKAVINIYAPNGDGKPLFSTFVSSTRVGDVSISNDNKYLAIAEIDSSGTYIQSNVKIFSIEKAIKNEKDYILYIHKADANQLLVKLQYQDKNNLVCMYNDKIEIINGEDRKTLLDMQNKKITFMSVKLSNNIVAVEEKSSGLFSADSIVNIISTSNKSESIYKSSEVAKEIITHGKIIALNFGTQIHFINTNGWLVKKYIGGQEITNVVLSNNIAGIIYRDKIEIINL